MGECGVPPSQREPPAMFGDGAATDRRFVKHVFDNVHGSITLDPVSSQNLAELEVYGHRTVSEVNLIFHKNFAASRSTGVIFFPDFAIYYKMQVAGPKAAGMNTNIYIFQVLHAWSIQELYTLDLSIPWVFIGSLGRQFVIFKPTKSHEQMSVQLVDYMVDQHHIDIDSDRLRKVKLHVHSLVKRNYVPLQHDPF
ncbi:hypothetical protein B296_00003568 [Ensete ventricosum]|uniref:Uncharacterized protein n=1 Tax=Ensete ventricosum TaxID=4639 RepID=A0A427AYL7_ENSVE|nr:hypothetical protein B296_00003568 [Ensete ventricosum]